MPSISHKEIIQTIQSTGNITAAADKLFVTQPYISKILKEIESELGTELFVRNYREMKITYAGRIYLNYLEETERQYEKMLLDMQMIAQEKKGQIRVGISPMLSPILLPPTYSLANQHFSHIDFKFIERPSVELNEMLQNDEIDIILGLGTSDKHTPYQFSQKHLYTSPIYLIASSSSRLFDPSYTKQIGPAISPSQLNDLPLILLNPDYVYRQNIDRLFKEQKLSLKISYETSNSYTAVGLVKNGIDNIFLPASVIVLENYQRCNIYPIDSPAFQMDFVIHYDANKYHAHYIHDFIQLAEDHFQANLSQQMLASIGKANQTGSHIRSA